MELADVGALVTGGAHRLGKGFTLALAEAGCRVAIHYGRSEDAARKTAEEALSLGPEPTLHQADLSDPQALATLVDEAGAAVGPIQVLINSAAEFPEDSLAEITRDRWERTLAVNLAAPVFLTQAFADALPDDREGAIVNITDWRVDRPYPDHFSYTMSKAALTGFTKAAAAALAPRIRVNAIALGAILPPPGQDSAYLRELAKDIPLRRTGSPELAANAVLALLRNDFITGQVLRVNGGADLV